MNLLEPGQMSIYVGPKWMNIAFHYQVGRMDWVRVLRRGHLGYCPPTSKFELYYETL